MKFLIGLLIGLAIGIGIGYMAKKNVITMVMSTDSKEIPHVKSGETLRWMDSTLKNRVAVNFPYGGGLCKEGKAIDISHDCTVAPGVDDTPLEYYTYTCDSCVDPDAGGGSDAVILDGQGQKGARAAKIPDFREIIYCDPDSNKSTATLVQNTATNPQPYPGQIILFFPEGNVGSTWTAGAGGDSPPNLLWLCGVQQYNQGSASKFCTVQGTAGTTYAFTLTTQKCQNNGTGTISVVAAPTPR